MTQNECYEDWPMITDDEDAEGDALLASQALRKANSKIQAVKIMADWRDDHADCLAAIITVDGTDYKISNWWLSREGLKMWIRAEAGVNSALVQLKKHLLKCC